MPLSSPNRTNGRHNGLSESAPEPDQTILVAGGAGYIGCVLVPRLLDRGYRVRLLDRLYFGEEALASFRDRIELVVADVRDVPDGALDGVDGVINLSGLSNDPTAEFDPEANWEMNAVATETLGRKCVERGIERYVFASSCSLYDGMPPGMHAEDAPIEPRAAYATSKRYGEEKLIELAGEGLCPVMLRNGTVYGWSPRMRFDLVVNTFVKDALLTGALKLHGGGWMWRPLVDVRDCADAMIAAYEAPAEKVRGEIFNVVHSNYQIRELAMIVAGSVQLTGREVRLEEAPAPKLYARLRVRQREALDHAGLHPAPLGARGRHRHARADRRARSGAAHRPALLQHPLARAPLRGQAGARAFPAVL